MAPVLLLLFLIYFWGAAFLFGWSRNFRFFASLSVATIVLVLAQLLPSPGSTIVGIGMAVVVGIDFLIPERLGIGALTWTEKKADRLLERARKLAASGEPNDLRAAIELLDPVIAAPGQLDERWRAAFRLQRRALLMRLGISPLPLGSRSPAESFRIVAVRWVTDLRLRRVIGYRSKIGALEETVALRAYLEDIRTILPPGPLGPDPAPRGPWIEEGRRSIAELDRLEIRHPDARAVQRALVNILEAELEGHLTAPTEEDATRYALLSATENEAWRRAQAPFEPH